MSDINDLNEIFDKINKNLSKKEFKTAEKNIKKILDKNPKNLKALFLLGSVYLEVKLRDQVNGYTAEIISTSTTSGTDVPMTEITQNPIFIDENMALQVEASGTFTNVFFVVPLIRIR